MNQISYTVYLLYLYICRIPPETFLPVVPGVQVKVHVLHSTYTMQPGRETRQCTCDVAVDQFGLSCQSHSWRERKTFRNINRFVPGYRPAQFSCIRCKSHIPMQSVCSRHPPARALLPIATKFPPVWSTNKTTPSVTPVGWAYALVL